MIWPKNNILVQGFCPLAIKINQFPDGFWLSIIQVLLCSVSLLRGIWSRFWTGDEYVGIICDNLCCSMNISDWLISTMNFWRVQYISSVLFLLLLREVWQGCHFGWILWITGSFTRIIKRKSSILSCNRCYGIRPLMASLCNTANL